MKKLKTITLATLLSLGFLLLSAAGTPKHENVREKIQHAVSLPAELKNPGYSQKVKVAFVLDNAGKVIEAVASTINLSLKHSLENQFRQLVLTELQAGTYNVEINFNVY